MPIVENPCVCHLDYLSDTMTSTYAVPDRFAPPCYPVGLTPPPGTLQSFYRGPPLDALSHGGPVIDDSGVYSALPGTPPPWNDLDLQDDRPTTQTDAASITLSEFPRDRLSFVETLGQGLFGEVDFAVCCNSVILTYYVCDDDDVSTR